MSNDERELRLNAKVRHFLTHRAGTVVAKDTKYEVEGDDGEFWFAWHRELERTESSRSRPMPDDDPASIAGTPTEWVGIPNDGQLADQLEAAFEKIEDGYVCQDLNLRKRLALVLAEFVR